MNKHTPRLILGLSILTPVLASALFLLVTVTGPANTDIVTLIPAVNPGSGQ